MSNRDVLTARHIKEMQDGLHDSALARGGNGALVVISSLAKYQDSLPDTTIILKTYARDWADELVQAERDKAESLHSSTHMATLRKAAAVEGNAEIEADESREAGPFVIPLDMMGSRSLSRTEMRMWLELIHSLIPLMP